MQATLSIHFGYRATFSTSIWVFLLRFPGLLIYQHNGGSDFELLTQLCADESKWNNNSPFGWFRWILGLLCTLEHLPITRPPLRAAIVFAMRLALMQSAAEWALSGEVNFAPGLLLSMWSTCQHDNNGQPTQLATTATNQIPLPWTMECVQHTSQTWRRPQQRASHAAHQAPKVVASQMRIKKCVPLSAAIWYLCARKMCLHKFSVPRNSDSLNWTCSKCLSIARTLTHTHTRNL